MDEDVRFLYKSNMEQKQVWQSVLSWNLFGEEADLPDVIHCETIEARSLLHDWEFAPHRHARLHQVLLVESGGGTATMEGMRHDLAPMTVINVPKNRVHGFSFTPGTHGWVVTLASETFEDVLTGSDWLKLVLDRPVVTDGGEELRAVMQDIFDEFAARDFGRAHVLRSLAGLLLGRTGRLLHERGAAGTPSEPNTLFSRFHALVELHFSDHMPVAGYARMLGVTPTHLTRIVRAVSGKPASQVIDDRIVQEARRNLVYTNLPVSSIAYALGYSDPAYFSRVFSRVTGMAPSRFRELAASSGG